MPYLSGSSQGQTARHQEFGLPHVHISFPFLVFASVALMFGVSFNPEKNEAIRRSVHWCKSWWLLSLDLDSS